MSNNAYMQKQLSQTYSDLVSISRLHMAQQYVALQVYVRRFAC